MPKYVRDEFHGYLRCGVLACGFGRARCDGCGFDRLVAFSCKLRGLCPSCGQRRMAETAADLVDTGFPKVAVRQWVLSLPWELDWATLLLRVWGWDVLKCPRCGGRLRFIAVIEQREVIDRILDHLGLPKAVPRTAPARAPPLED